MLKLTRFNRFIILIIVSLLLPIALYSESVFVNDGTIIEGKIVNEDDDKIFINNSSEESKEILRKDVIRVIFHDRYKNKKYITRTDGRTIEGYIVNENNASIIIRDVLNSPSETTISRNEIETISDNKPEERIVVLNSAVFLKEGTIVDCKIIKETAASFQIQTATGEKKDIPKNDILRIHYNNNYRDKKILNKTDGTKIEGYIMDEDYKSYTYRTDLDSPVEIKILKNDLKNISKKSE